jgi:hypothetical protein
MVILSMDVRHAFRGEANYPIEADDVNKEMMMVFSIAPRAVVLAKGLATAHVTQHLVHRKRAKVRCLTL